MLPGYEQLPLSGPEHLATTRDKLTVVDMLGGTEVWAILMVRKGSLVIRKQGTNQKAEFRTTKWSGWPVMWGNRQVQLLRPIGEVSVPAAEKVKKVKRAAPGGETKIAKCRALFAANPTLTREQIVALFISEAGCTPAGAVTYFLTCQKG